MTGIYHKKIRGPELVRLTDLYLRGYPMLHIVDELNNGRIERYQADRNKELPSRSQLRRTDVVKAIKDLREEWASQALSNIDEFINQELARIDKVETQYWEGWDASRKGKEGASKVSFDVDDETGPKVKTTAWRESCPGDPRFLDGILKCSKARADLLRPALQLNVNATGLSFVDLHYWAGQAETVGGMQPKAIIDQTFKGLDDE